LKSQFVKINALQGKGSRPEQSPGEWSPANTRSAIPFDQSQAGQTASGQPPYYPGAGHPSNWNAGSLPPPHPINGIPGQVPVTEQNTLKQQAMIGLITGPARNPNNVQAQMLAFDQLPPSPYQSGITPFAAMQPGSQTPHTPQTPPMLYPDVLSRPSMAPAPMPGYAPAPLSPMPMSYQGGGGFPPPGYLPQPPANGKQGHTRKKLRFPFWARIVLPVFLLLLIVVGGLAGYYYYNLSAPVSHIVGQQVTRLKGDEDPNANRNGVDILSGPRINILLLGSDTDQKFSNGSYLAQSDIVVTIDPASRKVGMLSIPRDFWINIPGSGMHKLDEAYGLGGVALSRFTIYQDFGIPINYYAWVGLDGFIKVIDTVGGVDVDVLHPITDDNYPDDVGNKTGDIFAYKRLYIPPGPQHLSGADALDYVRSRHADLVGDFGRSARQQQVLSALKTKLNNPDIVGKLPEIAHDLDGYVKTDMQLADVFKLMNLARGLDPNSVDRVILGPPYSQSGNTQSGESVVFPSCAQIVPVIAQMFALGDKAACNIQADSNTSTVASASQPSSTTKSSATNASLQVASQVASTSNMNLANGGDNLSGLHSLLDLVFMVVFESPQAIQA
jgi:LCP family protein required for cell wall assembly